MNKFIHTTIKLSFLSVIISMTALLNTAPIAGATTQTAHNGQSVVDNRLINPEIGIHITVDDVSKDYYVPMGTVSNALNYLNISLSDDDILNADLSDTVYLGQKIKIDRVNYACYPIYKSIPYKTVEQESDKLFVGQTKMLQKGKPGSTEYIYKDKYVNGELISHKCIKQQVLTYPTDKIIVKEVWDMSAQLPTVRRTQLMLSNTYSMITTLRSGTGCFICVQRIIMTAHPVIFIQHKALSCNMKMYSSLTVGRKNKTFFEKIPKILDFTPK